MFDSKANTIMIPNGPYPKCSQDNCDGTLLPMVEPATSHNYDLMPVWIEGTIILFWKCSKCKIIYK